VIGSARRSAPRLVEGIDIRSLPIGPEEAFVLSYVDGSCSDSDLACLTGLDPDRVARIMARLVELGAVVAEGGRPAPRSEPVPRMPPMPSGARRLWPAPAASDDVEIEAVDLEPGLQRQLEVLHQHLDSMDHYQLLGVDSRADVHTIKVAFYDLAAVFHPDRYFGKNLGSYRRKLEQVFARLTEAHDVLTRAGSRAKYDARVALHRRTNPSHRPPVAAARPAPVHRTDSQPPPASGGVLESSPPSSRVRPVRFFSAAPEDPDLRRRGLAIKFGHSSRPPVNQPRPSSQPSPSHRAAGEDLKRRRDQSVATAQNSQVDRYLALATESEARKDLAAAANALRVARSLAPEDPAIAVRLAELDRGAAAARWEDYAERANVEALDGRPAEAARLYQRAALGHPSAHLLERAAHFTLEAGGDLKRARELARQAVALAPQNAKCRLTLGRVYAAAKLRESALAELERAREIDPSCPGVKDCIRRVQRGEI
jgi:curved DNA-binding protein CbpA